MQMNRIVMLIRSSAVAGLVVGIVGLTPGNDASAQSGAELTKEIKDRCERQMGQYGRSLVLACVEQDIEAVGKISDYQKSHPRFASRCLKQMRSYGFSLVAACIDQDVEADRALSKY